MLHVGLGGAYVGLGRYRDALASCNEAIRLKPVDADAYVDLGSAYAGLGRYQDAVTAYNEANCLKPDYANARAGLGMTCLRLNTAERGPTEANVVWRIGRDPAGRARSKGLAVASEKGFNQPRVCILAAPGSSDASGREESPDYASVSTASRRSERQCVL